MNNKSFNKQNKDGEGMNKSVSKSDNKPNIEAIVKGGETRNFLNNLAKTMLDDLKEFSSQTVELFNMMNEKATQEYHLFLKNACKSNLTIAEHKKKVDSMSTDQNERTRKMEILRSLRERFYQPDQNNN